MSSRNLEYASEDDVLSQCTASSVTKCLLILVPKKGIARQYSAGGGEFGEANGVG